MNRLTAILIILYILNLSVTPIQGSESSLRLINKAQKVLYSNPSQAALWISQARASTTDHSVLSNALYIYAIAEKLLGNFEGSITALYEADLLSDEKNILLKGKIYNLMGLNYAMLNDYSKAIGLNEKAISLFKIKNDTLNLAVAYSNRGIIHSYINEIHQSDHFLRKALEINRSSGNLKNIAANLNNLCLYKGNLKEQFKFINEAININEKIGSVWSLAENYNNLGKLYLFANRYNDAISALDKAKELSTQINAKGILCDNYEYYAIAYSLTGEYKKAFEMQTNLYNLSKEIQSNNKLRSVEELIANRKLQEREKEAEKHRQEYKIELLRRNIYIIIIIFIAVLIIIFLLIQRYRRIKKIELMNSRILLEHSEHEVAKLKLLKQEMELNNIQSDLEHTKQEATNFAVFLNSRNELLDKIQMQIKQGYKMENSELIPHLKKINAFIKQYQTGDKSNSITLQSIDNKNVEFINKLLEKHPGLTSGEKHLAGLLRINLSTKEIAMLTGTTPKTINMNRYRLRKSLGISSDIDLSDYLKSF